MAGKADYSTVKGRRVAIWADHDAEGATAQEEAARAAATAGAESVELVPWTGPEGEGQGAADCPPALIDIIVATLKPWEGAPALDLDARPTVNGTGEGAEIPARLVWTSLATILATPPAQWLVEGLLAAGSVNLMYGAPKAGKTMFILGLLKAASQGADFLGFPLERMASWLISEQSENSLAPQLRTLRIGEDEDISVALWRHQPENTSTEAFADALLARIHRRTPMDGVRIAAGWVRELQGRWLGSIGVDWRSADGLQSPQRAIGALCGSCDARDGERIRSRELSRTGVARVCGEVGSVAGWQSGGEWNGSQSGHGASELGFPRPMLGKMQGKAARRAGDPSHQSEEPPPEGFGGRDPFTQADAGCPAGQVVRHHCTASQAPLAAKRPEGMWFSPTPYLRSRIAFSISAWRR